MEQEIITSRDNYIEFDNWIDQADIKKVLMISNSAVGYMETFNRHIERIKSKGIQIIRFRDFQPNPLYESVVKGVKVYREEGCDAIIAVGGGSAIDVAKCIKLYGGMSGDGAEGSYLRQEIVANGIPFLAIPTTAGSGSEATRYAVIYYKGSKQSVAHESCIPRTVLMAPEVLNTLPVYQKKSTMMDAFCHAIESFWSINSIKESKNYSIEAIQFLMNNMDGYLANTNDGNAGMMKAAYLAGKAINITQTTAGHAMCYKITSLFKIAHGHAAILCDKVLFPWMVENVDRCVDPRGKKYLFDMFEQLAAAMGCESIQAAIEKVDRIVDALKLEMPVATVGQFDELKNSVNPIRLKNHPIDLDIDTIDMLYHKILRKEE